MIKVINITGIVLFLHIKKKIIIFNVKYLRSFDKFSIQRYNQENSLQVYQFSSDFSISLYSKYV